jgi:hypothetical protein
VIDMGQVSSVRNRLSVLHHSLRHPWVEGGAIPRSAAVFVKAQRPGLFTEYS